MAATCAANLAHRLECHNELLPKRKHSDVRCVIRRLLFIITALLIISATSLGIRSALHPPVTSMIVPGATQIEVRQPSMGEQVISYHAPGPAYAWRATVEGDIARHGWERTNWWLPGMHSTFQYVYVSSPWFGAIWDAVELGGEPNIARISVRRWIELPWRWQRWLLYVPQNIVAGSIRFQR